VQVCVIVTPIFSKDLIATQFGNQIFCLDFLSENPGLNFDRKSFVVKYASVFSFELIAFLRLFNYAHFVIFNRYTLNFVEWFAPQNSEQLRRFAHEFHIFGSLDHTL